jgi:hypothetical protein
MEENVLRRLYFANLHPNFDPEWKYVREEDFINKHSKNVQRELREAPLPELNADEYQEIPMELYNELYSSGLVKYIKSWFSWAKKVNIDEADQTIDAQNAHDLDLK